MSCLLLNAHCSDKNNAAIELKRPVLVKVYAKVYWSSQTQIEHIVLRKGYKIKIFKIDKFIVLNGQKLGMRGVTSSHWNDIYYYFLKAKWPQLLTILGCFYLLANAFFASLYLLGGDSISQATPGSWWDAYFFSVQTWATIGYGGMAPKTRYADVLVAIESFCGLMSMSVVTGLVFAKFSRPRSKIVFTQNLIMSRFEGKPVLAFRMGNTRGNLIVEAKVRVVYSIEHVTAEGIKFRKLYDLDLIRDSNALFALTWQVMHELTPQSPMYNMSLEDLEKYQFQVVVSVTGIDEEFSSQVHARHLYLSKDIVSGVRFADVLSHNDGMRLVDYTKFHETIPTSNP